MNGRPARASQLSWRGWLVVALLGTLVAAFGVGCALIPVVKNIWIVPAAVVVLVFGGFAWLAWYGRKP